MNVKVRHYTSTTEREWGARIQWYGWRRFFGVGLSTNILAPAVAILACGWHLWLGRIPKIVEASWDVVVADLAKAKEEVMGSAKKQDVGFEKWVARQEELCKPGGVYERFAAFCQAQEDRLDLEDPTWRSRVDWDSLPVTKEK